MSFKKNRKGTDFPVIPIVLGIIFLVVAVAFFSRSNKSIDNTLNQKLSCKGALGIGYGSCVADGTCNSPNQVIETTDCKEKSAPICCISLEKQQFDSIANYGGDTTHDFTVNYIGAVNIADLKGKYKCTKNNNKDYDWTCPPNQDISLVLKINVTNGQTPLSIYADPWIVDQSGTYGDFYLQGTALQFNAGESKEVTLTIPLDKASTHSPPKAGLGYKITPAAKSDSLGIFRKTNSDQFFLITFSTT